MRTVDLSDAITTVQTGDVIAYPTEAVFGLGCDPRQSTAVEKILQLKQRPWQKGLIVIASQVEQLKPWINLQELYNLPHVLESWPGPNTWVMPCYPTVPSWIRGEHQSLAIRISAHPVCQALCEGLGHPIISTSANPAGLEPATTGQGVADYFGEAVTILAAAVGHATQPTTIRDALTQKVYRA